MRFFRESCRFLCLPLAALMLLVSMPWSISAHAALVTTDQVVSDSAAVAGDREKVVRFLQQDAVREQLVAMGVEPSEVEARLAALSPAELAQLSARIDQMPAGQGAIGAVVFAILIIFLVLLLTDLLGVTDVFPFVKKNR
ncbi:MAG TPA: PA2779 family protein [Alphaproteobacteria bacterium]|nr:PA2779 family protein [Alphaproteobacteria bacterium]